MVLAAACVSEHPRLELVATLDAMASQSRTLTVLVAAACCAAVLRSFWAASSPTFVAPQQSVHMGCQALSGGALAAGQVPAIVNTVPARPGVPAHFKVTTFRPWHPFFFERTNCSCVIRCFCGNRLCISAQALLFFSRSSAFSDRKFHGDS